VIPQQPARTADALSAASATDAARYVALTPEVANPLGEPPVTASAYVANAVRMEILCGGFRLGARIDQQALAQRYNVSIIPVREALKLLEAQGLVRTVPRRGTYVAELSLRELKEITSIRERLEGLAVRLATPHIRPETLDVLDDLNSRMDDVRDDQPPSVWRDLNREFHFRIYRDADASLLLQMIGTLWDRTSIYREVLANTPSVRRDSVNEHNQVLTQLRQGAAGLAAQAMRKHVRRGQRDMVTAEMGLGTTQK